MRINIATIALSLAFLLPQAFAVNKNVTHAAKQSQKHVSFVPTYQPLPAIQHLQDVTSTTTQKQAAMVPIKDSALPTIVDEKKSEATNKLPSQPKIQGILQHTYDRKNASWVESLPAGDAVQLANIAAQLIQKQVPERGASLQVNNVSTQQVNEPFSLSLSYLLKNLGYALCTSQDCANAVIIRYRLSHFDTAYLLRLKIDDTETAGLYAKTKVGTLETISPITSISRGND